MTLNLLTIDCMKINKVIYAKGRQSMLNTRRESMLQCHKAVRARFIIRLLKVKNTMTGARAQSILSLNLKMRIAWQTRDSTIVVRSCSRL